MRKEGEERKERKEIGCLSLYSSLKAVIGAGSVAMFCSSRLDIRFTS